MVFVVELELIVILLSINQACKISLKNNRHNFQDDVIKLRVFSDAP